MIGLHECPAGGGSVGGGGPQQRSGGARERAAQAVEYYNNNVLRARINAGLAGPRASYNDRHGRRLQHYHQVTHHHQDALYRSNSSLELLDGCEPRPSSPTLRREYGSHGSIDAIGEASARPVIGTSESFFAMLQDYRPAVLGSMVTDQRSPGPSEYLRGKVEVPTDAAGEDGAANERLPVASSPKLKHKLQRFWGGNANVKTSSSSGRVADDSVLPASSTGAMNNNGVASASTSADMEERQRRRAFAHYDCQSLTANLGYAAKLRGLLLARRRNTTTGASAASMLSTRSSTPDGDSGDEDAGDGQSNSLIESCPFFRNEIGGEEERVVCLTRVQQGSPQRRPLHRPPLAYGVAQLEFLTGETHWRHATCPYQRLPRPIESVDDGARYYRKHFFEQEHQNWFGMDEQLGPVAISMRREKVVPMASSERGSVVVGASSSSSSSSSSASQGNSYQYQYRLIIRTSELLTLRGTILEDAIPNLKSSSSSKSINAKEVLEYVAPEIQLGCLRLGVQTPQTEEQLIKLDEQGLTNHYKVGIMYCKAGQASEEEMYNNEEAGPAFLEFLDTIGERVRLKGFDKYKAGLDNKTDSTGLYSLYSQHQKCEIMFHVSTFLPFTPNNRQQLLRKRHIGNDIVTIVFQEPGAQPFTPKNIRSQFQHVFIIVRAINPCTENTHYSVAVSRSKEVPAFGPPIKEGAVYPKSKTFADFLLAKVVNAENAAHRSEKFATMATRTRQEYLKDLASNYTTTTMIDTGQKFSIFSSKKKEKIRPGFISDAVQRGAICWQVVLDDSGQSMLVECFLGISTDTLVLIEECTRQIVFVTPCKSILGWSAQTNSLRIYHHQGECITIHMRDSPGDRDELMEIMERLRAVTQGCVAQELSLRRDTLGRLGFHVQPDGVVTQVESMGLAWKAGLRQGSRLVEICKVAVSTLSHDQMVDLLKTSMSVTVTVIPPLADNVPRRGCTLQNCRFIMGNYESDYENLNADETKANNKKAAQLQQAVPGNHRKRYESFSPPRSSNSSGYGTGSSSKSFLPADSRFPANPEGTMTSSSSGHSSDDRWYELLEPPELESGLHQNATPPPLPAKLAGGSSAFQTTPKKSSDKMAHSMSHSQLSAGLNGTSNHHIHHNHSPQQHQPNHNKVQISHSLPLPHANFSLPLNNTSSNGIRYESFDQEVYKASEKMPSCLLKPGESRPSPRTANIEYLLTRKEYPTMNQLNAEMAKVCTGDENAPPGAIGAPSEDELSNSSGNVSPKMKRSSKHRNGNVATSSSRNHSPRPVNGEARLRPGVTPRSSNRNSANLSSSTLQEDLMKLINPDYIGDDIGVEPFKQPSTGDAKANKARSRENLANGALSMHQNGRAEVILTTARPATVISNASTASSPAPSDFKPSKEDQLSSPSRGGPHKPANYINNNLTAEPLPLPDVGDWSSLVDTATRAMLQVGEGPDGMQGEDEQWDDDEEEIIEHPKKDLSMTVSSSASVPELQSHLCELESRVSHETRRRLSLEDEVRRLREENRRLQDESQAAAHQLRRFTEWFFQTLDRQ